VGGVGHRVTRDVNEALLQEEGAGDADADAGENLMGDPPAADQNKGEGENDVDLEDLDEDGDDDGSSSTESDRSSELDDAAYMDMLQDSMGSSSESDSERRDSDSEDDNDDEPI